MITASRGYSRGDARFNAFIISGGSVRIVLDGAGNAGVHVAVGGDRSSRSTIEGFQVTTLTLTSPAFVNIIVTLGPGAAFDLSFSNVSEEEAMTIAQKFDWKGIQALLN